MTDPTGKRINRILGGLIAKYGNGMLGANPAPLSYNQARKRLLDLFREVIGEDIAVGSSKIVWGGKGDVMAESADDLRNGWNNKLRAEQRAKVGL